MKKRNLIFISLFILLIHSACKYTVFKEVSASDDLYRILLDDPAALCLDGSPATLYISQNGDPKKIYLEF